MKQEKAATPGDHLRSLVRLYMGGAFAVLMFLIAAMAVAVVHHSARIAGLAVASIVGDAMYLLWLTEHYLRMGKK